MHGCTNAADAGMRRSGLQSFAFPPSRQLLLHCSTFRHPCRSPGGQILTFSSLSTGELKKPAVSRLFDSWRRERDSNPRWSYQPHTPLAGERLQPLGHLSLIDGMPASIPTGRSGVKDKIRRSYRPGGLPAPPLPTPKTRPLSRA